MLEAKGWNRHVVPATSSYLQFTKMVCDQLQKGEDLQKWRVHKRYCPGIYTGGPMEHVVFWADFFTLVRRHCP